MLAYRTLAKIDDTLKFHLEMGGSLQDPVGRELVEKYAKEALTFDEISRIATQYHLTQHDIEWMMYAGIGSALEQSDYNPCINTAPNALPMLTVSLIFREPMRLENLLQVVQARLPHDATPEVRREMLTDATIEMCVETWRSHTQARGMARFQVLKGGPGLPNSKTGCFSLIIVAAASLTAGWKLTYWLT